MVRKRDVLRGIVRPIRKRRSWTMSNPEYRGRSVPHPVPGANSSRVSYAQWRAGAISLAEKRKQSARADTTAESRSAPYSPIASDRGRLEDEGSGGVPPEPAIPEGPGGVPAEQDEFRTPPDDYEAEHWRISERIANQEAAAAAARKRLMDALNEQNVRDAPRVYAERAERDELERRGASRANEEREMAARRWQAMQAANALYEREKVDREPWKYKLEWDDYFGYHVAVPIGGREDPVPIPDSILRDFGL